MRLAISLILLLAMQESRVGMSPRYNPQILVCVSCERMEHCSICFNFGLCVQGLKVTMKKHPSAFKLCGYLAETVKTVREEPMILYEGEPCEFRGS